MKMLITAFCLLPALAYADAQPTPFDQAAAEKLMTDLQTEMHLRAEVVDLQTQAKAADQAATQRLTAEQTVEKQLRAQISDLQAGMKALQKVANPSCKQAAISSNAPAPKTR
jgi:hypothetical protein